MKVHEENSTKESRVHKRLFTTKDMKVHEENSTKESRGNPHSSQRRA
jgi:hypothetical protein